MTKDYSNRFVWCFFDYLFENKYYEIIYAEEDLANTLSNLYSDSFAYIFYNENQTLEYETKDLINHHAPTKLNYNILYSHFSDRRPNLQWIQHVKNYFRQQYLKMYKYNKSKMEALSGNFDYSDPDFIKLRQQ